MRLLLALGLTCLAIASRAGDARLELDGTYESSWALGFERIEIEGLEFRYDRDTDELCDPWAEGFPRRDLSRSRGDSRARI